MTQHIIIFIFEKQGVTTPTLQHCMFFKSTFFQVIKKITESLNFKASKNYTWLVQPHFMHKATEAQSWQLSCPSSFYHCYRKFLHSPFLINSFKVNQIYPFTLKVFCLTSTHFHKPAERNSFCNFPSAKLGLMTF